ncbi:MAG TPA: sensor histidine kinase, partial [Ramlibacter sp.]
MRRRTLRGTLGWLLASLIAPLALGTLAVLVLESHRSAEQERERVSTLAGTLLRGVEAELAQSRTRLEVLAASPQFASGDFAQLHAFATTVASDSPGTAITLVDAHGQGLLSTGVPWGTPLPNYWTIGHANRKVPWEGGSLHVGSAGLSQVALEQDKVAYSDLFYGVNRRRPALALALPVRNGAGVRTAFVAVFSPDLLQDMVARSVGASGARVLVTDRNGVVIASNAESGLRVGEQARRVPEMATRESGTFQLRATADEQVLEGAFAVSRTTGYMVAVAQAAPPPPLPLLPAWTLTWLLVLSLACGVAVALVIFFARRLAAPLTQLAADLAHGRAPRDDFRSEIVEFQLLAGAVSAAVEGESFRRAEEERKVGELQDRALFAEQMVGIVSLDLRNPLLAALMSANALEGSQLPAGSRVFLQQVQVAVQRAQALVHELLDFTRARLGKGLPVDLAPVDLHRLVAEHLATLRRSYPDHALVHETLGQGACEADADRLLQLVDNLVNNAATYGDCDQPITVRTEIAPQEFRITVHNRGKPVPPEL